MIESLPAHSPVRGLVLNTAGSLSSLRGDYPAAHGWFVRAYEARRSVPQPRPIELHETLFNVATTTTDAAAQRADLEQVVAAFERLLGPHHRRTLYTRLILARTERDPELVLPLYASLCEAFREHHPDELATCRFDQGLRSAEAGRLEPAAAAFEQAAEQLDAFVRSIGPNAPLRMRLARARAQALACRGRHAEAVTELRSVLADVDGERPSWLRIWVAELGVELGEALVADGRPAEAEQALAAPLAELQALSELRFDADVERMLVRARLALSHALLDAVADGTIVPAQTASRVRALLDAAEPDLRATGDGGAWRLRELARLRAELPAPP